MKRILACINKLAQSRIVRFIISGFINTVLTYLLYLFLLLWLPYPASYSIAYFVGIFISYQLNRLIVFRTHQGVRTILLFPLVYVAQYFFGLLILWIWIDEIGGNAAGGPLVVVIATLPVTYFLTKYSFIRKGTR
jgi:putative flippase GtrA